MSNIIIVDAGNTLKDFCSECEAIMERYEVKITSVTMKQLPAMLKKIGKKGSSLLVISHSVLNKSSDLFYKTISDTPIPFFMALDTNKKGLTPVPNNLQELESFYSIIDPAMGARPLIPVFKSLLGKGNILDLRHTLNAVERYVDKELKKSSEDVTKAQKTHRSIDPLKTIRFHEIDIQYGFYAGTGELSEFFNIARKESEALILLSSAVGHLLTYTIINHFKTVDKLPDFSLPSLESFLMEIREALKKFERHFENSSETPNIFLARIDSKEMILEGYSIGSTMVYSVVEKHCRLLDTTSKGAKFLHVTEFSHSLERSERVIILSPGIAKNNVAQNANMKFNEILSTLEDPSDIADKVFSTLKPNDAKFLAYDSSIICLEVDANAIIKI